ncbi:MAG TPA: peptidoglycan recognition family protein [Thermoleophilaceae bacterium]
MSRTLKRGDAGPDVALFQRALNSIYRYWDAPPKEVLDEDGDFGARTELAFRRVRLRLGLELHRRDGEIIVTPRDRIVVRHVGRFLLARRNGKQYEIPPAAARTPDEIKRGLEARDYERKLRARFKKEGASVGSMGAHLTRIVRNQSSRNGIRPRIVVLHTTESHNTAGVNDLIGLAGWFDNPAAQASSHIGNDAEGNDIRLVPDDAKAWTQAAFNSVALSIEQVGQASQSTWPVAQLDNTARWVAYWSKKYSIPLIHSTTHGVCQHRDLGSAGGGHHDCGSDYPFAKVLQLARQYQ